MDISLPFDSSRESTELVKLSALYYDKVNILCPPPFGGIPTYSQGKLDDFSVLVESGIADVDYSYVSGTAIPGEMLKKFFNFIADQSFRNPLPNASLQDHWSTFSFPDSQLIDGHKSTKEDGFLPADSGNHPIDSFGLICYSLAQIYLVYDSIVRGQNLMISSSLINNFLKSLYTNNEALAPLQKTAEELIAPDAISILLPNLNQLHFEDILELRHAAKDELQEMRYYIGSLSEEFSPDDTKLENPKRLLERKINPAIKQFENKIYSLKIGTIQRALHSLRSPRTYTPMLTTFFTDIPSHIALAASMGLITAEAGAEYLKNKKELETDPLYFSVKLKKKVKKIIT